MRNKKSLEDLLGKTMSEGAFGTAAAVEKVLGKTDFIAALGTSKVVQDALHKTTSEGAFGASTAVEKVLGKTDFIAALGTSKVVQDALHKTTSEGAFGTAAAVEKVLGKTDFGLALGTLKALEKALGKTDFGFALGTSTSMTLGTSAAAAAWQKAFGADPHWTALTRTTLRLTQRLLPELPRAALATALESIGADPFPRAVRDAMMSSQLYRGSTSRVLSAVAAARLVQGERRDSVRSAHAVIDALAELEPASGTSVGVSDQLIGALKGLAGRINVTALSSKTKKLTLDQWLSLFSLILAIATGVRQVSRDDAQDRQAAELARTEEKRAEELRQTLVRFQSLREQLLAHLITSARGDDQQQVYCAVSSSHLREGLRSRSRRVGYVFIGDIVDIIGRRGRFAKVRYFDALTQTERVGWVAKKCLAKVRPRPTSAPAR